MGEHLVLIGGGHAHMQVMRQVEDFTSRGHRVTLVSPAPHHYYSGMGPGMLGGFYTPAEARLPVASLVEGGGGSFLADEVCAIDPSEHSLQLRSGGRLTYSVASFNVGSEIALTEGFAAGPLAVPVKPVVQLALARQTLASLPAKGTQRIGVIGGGPAGVEVAGNTARCLGAAGRRAEVSLLTGDRLLPTGPSQARSRVLKNFRKRGIRVAEHRRVTGNQAGTVVFADGAEERFDLIFLALGVRPPGLFRASGLPCDDEGGLLVNSRLQSLAAADIFGGGDCIGFAERPLPKVGVYAVRQNPVLHHNLLAALEGRRLQEFAPQKHFLLIFNLGDQRGLLQRHPWTVAGRWPFWLKDWLDRRFIRSNQPAARPLAASAGKG